VLGAHAEVHRVGASAVNVLQVWGQQTEATFLVDRDPPSVTVSVGGSSVSVVLRSPNVTATVRAFDGHSATNMTVQLIVRASNGTEAMNTSPLLRLVDGVHTADVGVVALADGVYVVEARVWDGVGNPGAAASVVVTVDTVAPAVTASEFQWPMYSSTSATTVCVVVSDASAGACNVTMVTLGAAPMPLQLNPSVALVGGGSVYCGSILWDGFQGNASVDVVAVDPADNRGTATLWLVHDSVAPVHSVALASETVSGVCAVAKGVTVCRDAAGLTLRGTCDSGGSTVASPCWVEWALLQLEVLQQASCGFSGSTTTGNVSVPAGYWTRVEQGAFAVNVSAAAMAAVSGALTQQLAAKVALVTRPMDAAGPWAVGMCGLCLFVCLFVWVCVGSHVWAMACLTRAKGAGSRVGGPPLVILICHGMC
jgi:hypothetical protein